MLLTALTLFCCFANVQFGRQRVVLAFKLNGFNDIVTSTILYASYFWFTARVMMRSYLLDTFLTKTRWCFFNYVLKYRQSSVNCSIIANIYRGQLQCKCVCNSCKYINESASNLQQNLIAEWGLFHMILEKCIPNGMLFYILDQCLLQIRHITVSCFVEYFEQYAYVHVCEYIQGYKKKPVI